MSAVNVCAFALRVLLKRDREEREKVDGFALVEPSAFLSFQPLRIIVLICFFNFGKTIESSADKIALMKPDTVFINCARGPIVDNAALAKALNEDKLGFACLDVFDMEPPIPEDYPILSAKNTLLTPHQAFISEESMIRRAKIVFDNVYAYLDGSPVNVCK